MLLCGGASGIIPKRSHTSSHLQRPLLESEGQTGLRTNFEFSALALTVKPVPTHPHVDGF